MPKYRKKPVVVDATQFNYIDNIDGPKTCELAKSLGLSRNEPHSLIWEVKTPLGWRIVRDGDWIITGIQGEKYPCKPDIFEATHEPVETTIIQAPYLGPHTPEILVDPHVVGK